MAKARVLIADDSATIQKVFELAFEKEDIDVILSGSGREALERAAELKPDVVIADVSMPDMDGFELCRALKERQETADVPVYLLSSALDDFDEEKAREAGAAGRFEKPFRSEDMVSQVMAVIDPGSAALEEDTFEDVDVSEDSILEAVELIEGEDEILGEGDDAPGDDEDVDSSAPPKVLSLRPEDAVDDGDEDEDAGLEVVSGAEDVLEEDEERGPMMEEDEPLVIGNGGGMEGLANTREVDDRERPEDDLADALETTPVKEPEEAVFPADHGPAGVDEADRADGEAQDEQRDNGLSEEARKLIREIDEADADMERGPSEEAAGIYEKEAAERAGEAEEIEALDMERLSGMVEEAVKRAIGERMNHESLEAAVTSSVRSVLDVMRPELLETFRKVAADVTLNVAEDLVKQTIEQIKAGD
ncbi:MAG: response regulator [Candidatus Nitrospinota bacterium M3_3B_026]